MPARRAAKATGCVQRTDGPAQLTSTSASGRTVGLLKDAVASFTTNCVRGIEPDEERLRRYAERSLMNVTALLFLLILFPERTCLFAKLRLND